MGLVYAAELRPSKMELIAAWLPQQAWFDAEVPLGRLGAFRFNDPAGVVGMETLIVGHGDRVYQVPLSYRGAPLEGAEEFLMGTMEHSVLGSRWVYDAAGDPVYAAELAAALLAGKPQAVESREVDGQLEILPFTAQVANTRPSHAGLPQLRLGALVTMDAVTRIPAGDVNLVIHRVLDTAGVVPEAAGSAVSALTATWPQQKAPVVLAAALPG
ncbi:hypothetical protein ACFUCV_03870 [Specibacter sp. NPDC057265]|uniref:CG0192-related protein n=1 Tax=Specibacter sp. NPDC057265 TaxID=3346075 RepID=UPI00364073D6